MTTSIYLKKGEKTISIPPLFIEEPVLRCQECERPCLCVFEASMLPIFCDFLI